MFWGLVIYLVGVLVAGIVLFSLFVDWNNDGFTNKEIKKQILESVPFLFFSWVIPICMLFVYIIILSSEKIELLLDIIINKFRSGH